MEREGVGCSTCQGLVFKYVKDIVDADEAEPVEAPDSSTAPTEEGPPGYAAAPIELLWPNGQVFQVWFLKKRARHHAHIKMIKEVVKEWEKYANVTFTFPEKWDMNSPPEVRLRFWDKPPGYKAEHPAHNINDGYWSYVGTECEQIAEKDAEENFWNPTMSLREADLTRYAADFRATILHEFGHMLGLIHEHQRPDAKLLINYNMDEVYKHYRGMGWTKQRVDEQVMNFHEYRGKSAIGATEFDTTSIMMYDLPAHILVDPTKAVPKNTALSQLDKDFVARLYPKGVAERTDFQPHEIIPDPVEVVS